MKVLLNILLGFLTQAVWCQPTVTVSLPSIALLDLDNTSAITLKFTAPTVAGASITSPATNTSKWLNFTSAVAPGITRTVSAQIISGSIPAGVRLKLETATYAGSGAGALGSVTSPIYITAAATTFISNIGGAYTGNGTGNGYNLKYSLEIQDYSLLRNTNNSFTVIYTLSD